MKALALLTGLVIAGCIGNPVGTNETPDEFIDAARSWEGASINEMIAVWGPPNDGLTEPSGDEQGAARWKFDWTQGHCRDHVSPQTASASCRTDPGSGQQWCPQTDPIPESDVCRSAVQGSRNYRHRCSVKTMFRVSGTITEVEAVSVRCTEAFDDWLAELTY